MVRSTLKYSILCGVFLCVLFFVSLNFGSNPLLEIRHFIVDLFVFLLFIFFAGKEFKDFGNGGFLHFWQGISIGFIVFLPAVIIFSIVLYLIFLSYPELIDGYKEGARTILDSKRDVFLAQFDESQLLEQKMAIEKVTESDLVLGTFWKKLFAGFFVTPVVAIILRRKPK